MACGSKYCPGEFPGGPGDLGSIPGQGTIWVLFCFFLPSYRNSCSEKAMAPQSSILAWKIPWTEEPGALQSMGSLGVRHD